MQSLFTGAAARKGKKKGRSRDLPSEVNIGLLLFAFFSLLAGRGSGARLCAGALLARTLGLLLAFFFALLFAFLQALFFTLLFAFLLALRFIVLT